eukprot:TRINITY_DN6134_c0_g1_i9.p1 TRINITY_DN6134_c0_g1~~TRINITY_DN6134_c0_g1_i9.p1  ORF type:complete len:130 (+),score=20.64 TRINITY_DN6134_c0_g1_i9:323-712(+)
MKGREDFHIFSNQRVKVMPNKNKRACVTSYTLHDELLETTVDSKYLGVTITNNLTWSARVEKTAGKANRALSFLRSNINDRSLKVNANIGECLSRLGSTPAERQQYSEGPTTSRKIRPQQLHRRNTRLC